MITRLIDAREWRRGHPGWVEVAYDPSLNAMLAARLWYWPFAVVWSVWSTSSRRFVLREIPRGVRV